MSEVKEGTTPLHEKIRYCRNWSDLDRVLNLQYNTNYQITWTALADAIEDEYIQLPRDVFGNTWKVGDRLEFWADAITVKTGNVIGYTYNGVWYLIVKTEDDTVVSLLYMNCIRPADKLMILDADGIPHKQGDVIYSIETGEEYEIVKLESNIPGDCHDMTVVDVAGVESRAMGKLYTHEKPQFDAYGERIKVGDNVWDVNNPAGEMLTVVDIIAEDDVIICDDKLTYTPDLLAHRTPDSYEKVLVSLSQYALPDGSPVEPTQLRDAIKDAYVRLKFLVARGVK